MALTPTRYAINKTTTVQANGAVTSTSRTYNAGELVVVIYSAENAGFGDGGVFSIANSGSAQAWTLITSQAAIDECPVAAWFCVMDTTQAMTITAQRTSVGSYRAWIGVEKFSGQHATTPVPAGNRFSGRNTTDASQSITPTSVGSCLRFWASDWNDTNSFAAIANCSILESNQTAGSATVVWIAPTTDPRPNASAFTIGETDTSGLISWLAFEVQSEPSGGSYTLPADSGSYNLSGQAAGLVFQRNAFPADQGAYALTGQNVTLSYNAARVLPAEVGLYTVIGSNALVDVAMNAAAGSYTLTGQNVTLTYQGLNTFSIIAESGSYALTGQTVNLFDNAKLFVDFGQYNLNGIATALTWSGAPASGTGGPNRGARMSLSSIRLGL